MKGLCQYKDALGKPGEGFHKHVFGVAVFDLLGTVLICILIWYITKWKAWKIALGIIILTILIHRLFCVQTTVNKFIFGSEK
jgi:hypothetical protein